MILGFTGTRQGMSDAQRGVVRDWLRNSLDDLNVIVHGGAEGADAEFDEAITAAFGISHYNFPELGIVCEVYPATVERFSFWRRKDQAKRFVHSPMDPLKRNRIVVNQSHKMLATPAEAEEQPRGGTWSTIRYARKIGKPIAIIRPDGVVAE